MILRPPSRLDSKMLDALSASGFANYGLTSQVSATGLRDKTVSTPSTSDSAANAQEIRDLAETDRKVRAHEAAHLAAAGGLALSGASFGYTRGPDGKQYAVSGEVSISIREGRDAAETLRIAEQIRRAALAPADPSGQDRSVAAQADAMASQARADMLQQQFAAASGGQTLGNRLDTRA